MANKIVWTMVARTGSAVNKVDVGYTLIGSNYEIKKVLAAQLAREIMSGAVTVTNLAVENGKIVSTNGALDKYTYFDANTGKIEGKARPVILNRVEKDGKLVGYTVFTHTGQVKECNVATTVSLYNAYGIANGKIRHTEHGDIISSINGVFPLRELEVAKAQEGTVTVELKFMCEARREGEDGNIRYVGALISGTSAAKISKALDTLTDSNAKVAATLLKLGGEDTRKSTEVLRVNPTSFYCVFELKMLETLKTSGAEVVVKKIDSDYAIIFSNMIYDKEQDYTELSARIETGSDKKIKKIDFPEDTPALEEEKFKAFIGKCLQVIGTSLK